MYFIGGLSGGWEGEGEGDEWEKSTARGWSEGGAKKSKQTTYDAESH